MSIRYLPSKLLKKIAPVKKLEKLVTSKLTLNKAILAMFDGIGFIKKAKIKAVCLKTIKQYKKRYEVIKEEGTPAKEAKQEALADEALLINRVQNAVIYQVSSEIKDRYLGEFYKWLPSDAETPDPQHQLKYGKTYQVGKGEFPGERWGCRCGVEILVSEKTLDI
jgi:hypothetical protein